MSGKSICTIRLEGVKWLILVLGHTPIGLLVRETLCKLYYIIQCTPDGPLNYQMMTTETEASFWLEISLQISYSRKNVGEVKMW